MKKLLRKMLSGFLSLCFLFAFITPAMASESRLIGSEKELTTSQNEYDMMLSVKKMSDAQLRTQGYSEKDIRDLRAGSYEEALLERAKLPEETLKLYGYTEEQISILKSYDGSPIENNPQLSIAAATMSGTATATYMSQTSAQFTYVWAWSSTPVAMFTDSIGMAFNGISNTSSNVNYSLSSGSSSVEYYTLTNFYSSFKSFQVSALGMNGGARVNFPGSGGISAGGENTYAKKGSVSLSISKVGSTVTVEQVGCAFVYAHARIAVLPTLSVNLLTGAVSPTITIVKNADRANGAGAWYRSNGTKGTFIPR